VPRSEHVGSLVRPAALVDTLRALGLVADLEVVPDVHAQVSAPKPTTEQLEELSRLEDQLIRDAVAKQEAIGLDVLTDGEFKRVFFTGSFDTAVTGFEPSGTLINFYNDEGVAFQTTERPRVAERLQIVSNPLAEEARLLSSITDRPFKVTLPAASLFQWPGSFTPGVTDRVYADRDELADHIVTLLRQLIDGAVDAGARYIQCDFPLYPLFVDKEHHQARWQAMGMTDDEHLHRLLRADRDVVADLPDDVTTSIHICRGNTAGAWMAEGSLEPVAEHVFNLPYDRFLLELDDQPHQGDYSQLRHLPKGKVAVLGIVSSQTTELEREDDLLREIEDASRYVDIDQLAISPQCGFASLVDLQGSEMEPSTQDSQWRKLELLARVADRVWSR
jgi:5-methyltetrahydropteroyltriglutamate--homocysteine methyltransferase